jgi:hypothetical protein
MAVNDIHQVVVRQLLHSQTILNVLHYRVSVDGGAATPSDLATLITNNVIPQFKQCQSNELTHVDIVVQKIWPLPPFVPIFSAVAAGAGSIAQNSLPTSMTAVITKRTAFAGRKYRGRVFVCGVPITLELDSQITAAGLILYNNLAAVLDDAQTSALGANAWVPIIWHRVPKTFDTVVSADARPILRNQRRRQVGKGV